MKHSVLTLVAFLLLAAGPAFSQEREYSFKKDTVKFTREMLPEKYQIDTRVDNMGYWRKMAEAGLVPVAPQSIAPAPIKRTSKIMARGIAVGNSPDIPVTSSNTTQSENSVFIDPDDAASLINSNNSTPNPSTGSIYGADAFNSTDSAATWGGTYQGAGGGNSGDPTTAINNNGRWFVGFINNNSGQSVAYSDNQGSSWTVKTVANAPSGFNNMLDKNHLWIDNSPSSTYVGYLYDAWTTFGGNNDGQIGVSRSTDAGNSWQASQHVSSAVNAGSHNQGVNIKTGPNGEVYVVWAIYDSWPSDENALAMARSLDGGQTWLPATRIINNIKGIRNHAVTQNMRVNSFPCVAVDISNGDNRGNIYVVWTNVNTPGVNTGSGVEVYMIKSSDQGATWSAPLKINSDPLGTGKQHYLPWITCDPDNGNVAIVFYDNRNVSASQAEAWCAVSIDGGETFTDFLVSDVAFTPTPVPNMADSYMGDYLAIAAQDGVVYPCWTDTRSGQAMTYVSPFLLTPAMNQAYIAYQGHVLNDMTTGNNNGNLDFGENLMLSLAVKNIGDKPDTNVMVTLRSESPYITMLDSTENYGNFAIGEIKTIPDGFAFHVSDSVPNGTEIVFDVIAVNNLDSVNYSYFTIDAYAPELTIDNIRILDPAGNNNNVLDPGETADVVIHYTNNSLFYALDPVCHLNCPQTFITIANPAVSIPTVAPGNSDSAVFHVTVGNVFTGSAAQFTNLVNYSFQSSQMSFIESIGLIVEDWETGTFTKFPWVAGGNTDWVLDDVNKYEGTFSAHSGTVGNNQSSSLSVSYNVMYNDSISFYRKISSELFHDVLSFYIDGLRVGQWSGNQNWKRMSYPVLAGPHVFKWEYLKDGSNAIGSDAGWVDFIVFPPEQRTMSYAGNNMSICEGQQALMNATATNYQSLSWSSSGTGSFNDNTLLNPLYTPSESDIAAGSVTLTLTVTGFSAGETSVSSMLLSISPRPTAFAGSDQAICEGVTLDLTGASATNYTTLSWSTDGDGSFNNPGILQPVYTPGAGDIGSGTVALYLVADPGNACQPVRDTVSLLIHKLPSVLLEAASTVCLGDSIQLTYNLQGTAPFVVTFANGETRNIPVSVWQEWLNPDATTTYSVTTVSDATGCSGTSSATTTLQVLPIPVLSLPADTNICGNLSINLNANAQGAVSYLWSPGGQTSATITIDSVGVGLGVHEYTLAATGSNGCKAYASIAVNFRDCTGLEEMVGNVAFNIYPNPNNGQFTIDFKSGKQESVNVRIVNASGDVVFNLADLKVNGTLSKHFNLKNVPQGSYLLTLENGQTQIARKLVITR